MSRPRLFLTETMRPAFESALAKAGIKGFRFHDLRHTAASHLIMRGASLRDVQEILGHADLKMTQRYAHLSPAHLRGAVERLEGLTGITHVRHPEPVEARLMFIMGLLLLGLAAIAWFFPRALAYPLVFILLWISIVLLYKAYRLRTERNAPAVDRERVADAPQAHD